LSKTGHQYDWRNYLGEHRNLHKVKGRSRNLKDMDDKMMSRKLSLDVVRYFLQFFSSSGLVA